MSDRDDSPNITFCGSTDHAVDAPLVDMMKSRHVGSVNPRSMPAPCPCPPPPARSRTPSDRTSRLAIRKAEPFEPVTLGHIRSHGCKDLLIYCDSGRCHHSATMNADHLTDDTRVRFTLSPNGLHEVRTYRGRRTARLGSACRQAARYNRW